jgi:hypothetical protein
MHQLARYCAGWVSATALATGVSWVAIDNLVTTAALSRPLAAPSPSSTSPGTDTGQAAEADQAPGTTPSPSAIRPATGGNTTPTPSRRARRPATGKVQPTPPAEQDEKAAPSPTPASSARGYSMKGGQVVLDLRADSATLVSAVPAAGYRTESWTTEYWLRVDFVDGDRRSSMIVSWYQHAPTVERTET